MYFFIYLGFKKNLILRWVLVVELAGTFCDGGAELGWRHCRADSRALPPDMRHSPAAATHALRLGPAGQILAVQEHEARKQGMLRPWAQWSVNAALQISD